MAYDKNITYGSVIDIMSREQKTVMHALIDQALSDKQVESKPTNCPNCGAPIRGYECEYCGTVFDLERRNEERNRIIIDMRNFTLQQSTYDLYDKAIKTMRRYTGE